MTVTALDTHPMSDKGGNGSATTRVWQQPTTGKIHRTPNCSVARRSRYGLVTLEIRRADLIDADRCRKCWRA